MLTFESLVNGIFFWPAMISLVSVVLVKKKKKTAKKRNGTPLAVSSAIYNEPLNRY